MGVCDYFSDCLSPASRRHWRSLDPKLGIADYPQSFRYFPQILLDFTEISVYSQNKFTDISVHVRG